MTKQKDAQDGGLTAASSGPADANDALETPLLLTEPAPTEPDPVLETGSADKPYDQPPRRNGLLGGLIGGVLAAAFGFGLAKYVPGGWPLQDNSALRSQIGTQAGDIQKMKESLAAAGSLDVIEKRLTSLEAVNSGQTAVDLNPLQDRITAVEATLSSLKAATGDGNVAERLREIQDRISSLETSPTTSPDAAADADARIKEAEAAAAASAAEAEKAHMKSTQTVALTRISSALDSGGAFSEVLPDLQVSVPDALVAVAESGAPTMQELQTAFPDAARHALDVALRADMGGSWADRATTFLKTQTGARSLTPRDGSDPDAILSRAEAALDSGDLSTTMTELTGLPENARQAIAEWETLAQRRLAATEAFKELSASLGR